MIKLCIFDLDGTLVDSLGGIAHFGNYTLRTMGYDEIDSENFKYFAGDGKKTLLHRMLKYHNIDTPEIFSRAELIYDRAYEGNPLEKTTVFDGIPDLLKNLKKKNLRLAVCSNKPDNVVCDIVKTIFGDMFDIVIGQKDNQKKKPEPDIALKIAEHCGVSACECLFIGDSNVDILTAKNAKMHSCGVLWGFRDFDELKEAGADFIISDPNEILNIVNGDLL